MEGEWELVCNLSNGANSNDLELTLTQFSRSHHSLTLNISQTALSVLCAQLTRDLSAIAKFLLRLYISFILFIQALS